MESFGLRNATAVSHLDEWCGMGAADQQTRQTAPQQEYVDKHE